MRRWGSCLCLIAGLAAQAEDAGHGALDAAREPLRKVVAPVFRDGRLILDRSGWPRGDFDFQSDLSREDQRREIAEDLAVAQEAIPDHLIGGDSPFGRPSATPMFDAIIAAGGGSRSGGTIKAGSRVRRSETGNDLLAWLTTYDETGFIKMRLVEVEGAKRTLDVEESPATGLSIRVESPEAGLSLALPLRPTGVSRSWAGRVAESAFFRKRTSPLSYGARRTRCRGTSFVPSPASESPWRRTVACRR